MVEEIEFAESKAAASQNSDFSQPAPAPAPAADGFMNIPSGFEELPFN